MNLLVFDVGGTSVKYSLWQNNQLTTTNHFSSPATWQDLKAELVAVKEKFSLTTTLNGVAFSIPGAVVKETGIVAGDSALPYIHHFPIQTELEAVFGLPVTLENDAKCAAIAEKWQGAAQNKEEVLFVIIGTGIGGAIFANNQLCYGAHLHAGEFGYMILNSKGQGFSELSSPVQMAKRYCEQKGIPTETHSGKDVFAFAKEGDKVAVREVELFYDYTAIGLYNLLISVDPEIIVIGGGVSANPEIVAELEKRVNKLLQKVAITDFTARVVPCQFGNDANLIGAVKNFIDQHQ